jgi:hypothetical protein
VKFYHPVTLAPAAEDALPVRLGSSGVSFSKQLNGGVPVTLSVSATSPLDDIKYQWRKDLQNIDGATSSTYSVIASAFTSGQYDVVVSNPASSVTSNALSLRVFTKPVFTRQPASQTVEAGRSASLTVGVSGFDAPSLQWFKDGVAIDGATGTSIVVTGFSSSKVGEYYVRASNSGGNTQSESARLSLPVELIGKPLIRGFAQSQAVVAGSTVTFTVDALNATQYQWRKNGVAIPGATAATLVVSNVQEVDVAAYSVLVSNSVDDVLSPSVNISLRAEVNQGDRRDLFNAVAGSNGGLFAARLRRSSIPSGTPEGYVKMNVTRVGTASGQYLSGLGISRFSARFKLVSGQQVAEVAGVAGGTLRLTITNDPVNPVVSAQLVGSGESAPVKMARLGTKNLTLSKAYTGTFADRDSGSLQGFTMTRINLASGTVFVSGMLPESGVRFSASSGMYSDPDGLSAASMCDFIVRVSSGLRLYATWKLETATQSGDVSVAAAAIGDTKDYDLTGASYSPAPLGEILFPFVSTRDEAVVTLAGSELGRFTATGNRLVPKASAFAAAGGRFSLSYNASTGQVSGLVSLASGGPLRSFVGVILQGDYRQNGGVMGVGVTRSGETIRFEPAN